MTQDEIDTMWQKAMHQSIKEGEMFTRYQFAHLVADKATEEANARANASWTLMCKKMVALEREALAQHDSVQAKPEPEQEPVGALTLGGIIDTSDGPEYEEWDIEWNSRAIEALQERLVTGDPVTLEIYTSPPQCKPLTDEEIEQMGLSNYIKVVRETEARFKEKNGL